MKNLDNSLDVLNLDESFSNMSGKNKAIADKLAAEASKRRAEKEAIRARQEAEKESERLNIENEKKLQLAREFATIAAQKGQVYNEATYQEYKSSKEKEGSIAKKMNPILMWSLVGVGIVGLAITGYFVFKPKSMKLSLKK